MHAPNKPASDRVAPSAVLPPSRRFSPIPMAPLVGGVILGVGLLSGAAGAAEGSYTVVPTAIADVRPVAATVEGVKTLPARVRTGGTVAELHVREGDWVTAGQVLAVLSDAKVRAQKAAADARVAEARARLAQAGQDLTRNRPLVPDGVTSPARLDAMEAAFSAATAALAAARADQATADARLEQARVLAPAAGRVVQVPAGPGMELMPGEVAAVIAVAPLTVRVRVPESAATRLRAGDTLWVEVPHDGAAPRRAAATISLVYPRIEQGELVVDATVPGLPDDHVGERLTAWVPEGRRMAYTVPARFLRSRFGMDYVRLRLEGGKTVDVPVQPGQPVPPDPANGPAKGPGVNAGGEGGMVEILSGLRAGDVVVAP